MANPEKSCLNILLADDNPDDIEITLRAFAGAGYEDRLIVVHDGEEAIAYLNKCYQPQASAPKPDLILLDIKMPRMDGLQALEMIKQEPRFKLLPVIMLTSSENEKDILESYRKGAAGYIPKPLGFDEFEAAVKSFSAYWHQISRLPG